MATADGFKVLRSLNLYIDSLLKDTIDFLTKKFNQSTHVFTTASPFGQTLLAMENISQLIFFYIEDSITELNINEAVRLSSIYSLATLAGHNPSRAIGAVGEFSLFTSTAGTELPTDLVILPNFTRVRCLNNNLTYVLDLPQEDVKFSLTGSDNGKTFAIKQGNIETQRFVAKGNATESIAVGSPQNYFVDNFLVNVFVNGEKWTKYESIIDIPRGEKGYIVKTGITNGVDIFFGNNNFGKIPTKGSEIIVEYLVCDGRQGNLFTDKIEDVKFEWVDTAFSLLGDEIDMNEFTFIQTASPPNFGANAEPPELTRLIAPRTSKSFALVSPDNYEVLLEKLQLFSIIRVFLDEEDDRLINIFVVPDITPLFQSGQDYFNVDLDKFSLSNFQKQELLKYIEKSGTKLISTDIKFLDPIISRYVINTSIIVFDDVATEVIKKDIQIALGNYFIQNKRRKRIPRSDLIKLIEDVKGVDSVNIRIVSDKDETAAILNPDATPTGTDNFNDIIINDFELPVIRGGFTDRYGNEYDEGLSDESLGSVNIEINEIIPRPKSLKK